MARPHYRTTWPPILHAAAVWLSYGQGLEMFSNSNCDNDTSATAETKKTQDDINADKFHLLLGVCVEGLANTRSADLTKDQVMSCLRTLLALLDHRFFRWHLASSNSPSSKVILVELCNVLHRYVQWCSIENRQSPIYVVYFHYSRRPDGCSECCHNLALFTHLFHI